MLKMRIAQARANNVRRKLFEKRIEYFKSGIKATDKDYRLLTKQYLHIQDLEMKVYEYENQMENVFGKEKLLNIQY